MYVFFFKIFLIILKWQVCLSLLGLCHRRCGVTRFVWDLGVGMIFLTVMVVLLVIVMCILFLNFE